MRNQEVQQHLQAIADRNDGLLTPLMVIDESKDPKHPLHSRFEWDNKEAGHKWRIHQARNLINAVYYEQKTETYTAKVPVFVHDPDLPEGEQGYRPTVSFIQEDVRAKKVLLAELDRVTSALRRAQAVAGVLGFSTQIDDLLAQAGELRSEAE